MKTNRVVLIFALAWHVAACSAEKGLVAHYTFDEGKGVIARDHGGKGNHAKVFNGAKWVKGPWGAALQLDGKDDYVDAGKDDSLNIAARGTVMIWCRPTTLQGGLVNWSTGGAWKDERLVLAVNTYRGGNTTAGYMSAGTRVSSYGGFGNFGTLPINSWTHLAFSLDGRLVSSYRDGLLTHAASQPLKPDIKGVPLWIGRCQGLGKAYFHGLVDDVRVYSRVVSAREILAYYKKEAPVRGKDTSEFDQVKIEVKACPGPGKIMATLDARAWQPLPDGAHLRVSLFNRGALKPTKQIEIADTALSEAVFDVQRAPPTQYILRAAVVGPNGAQIGKESAKKVLWSGQLPAFKDVKILNNLCWELLNVKGDANIGQRQRFKLPIDRWVFIRGTADVLPGGEVRLTIDSDPRILALHSKSGSLEAMRYLKAGKHTVHVSRKGNGRLKQLVVRGVPALQHAFYGANPHIHAHGPYDWEFLKKHILPHVNVMIGSNPKPEHIKAWTDMGRRWIAATQNARRVKATDKDAVEKACAYWSRSPGFNHPLMDGVIADEFTGDEHPIYAVYHKALGKLYSNPEFKDRGFSPYTYGEGFSYAENPKKFVRVCLREGGYICREWYLTEQPTATAARHLIRGRMTASMKTWEKGLPGSTHRMVIVLGYMSQPTESLNIDPSVNFKVYMDMQLRALATDPAFFGLGGIQEYHSSYCDEENVRWAAKLYRHYALEGNTQPLTSDPYELRHIQNPDFARGTASWTVRPAEPGSIRTKEHKCYSWLQGRYPRTGLGDTFLWMKRSAKRPNVFRQRIKNLTPGRLYSMKMITADYQDLVQEKSRKKVHAVSIKLENVDIAPGKKKNFQFTFPNCYAHKLGKFNAHYNYWMNYHWRVFRAKDPEGQLVVTDWKSRTDPGGPSGRQLMFNFIEIQPYIGD